MQSERYCLGECRVRSQAQRNLEAGPVVRPFSQEYVINANYRIIPCVKRWKSSIEMDVWLAIYNILRASTQIMSNDNSMNLR